MNNSLSDLNNYKFNLLSSLKFKYSTQIVVI
jgi:hypothetical protein